MKLKKILKRTGITLIVLIIILAITPYIFKDKIKSMITDAINNNINATVSFNDARLNLFSNFPKASVTVDQILLKNHAPFKGDTLFYADKIDLNMSLGELFKSKNEALHINSVNAINGKINIHTNKNGVGNFDIAKEPEIGNLPNEKEEETTNEAMSLSIKEYNIENMTFNYVDDTSKMKISLKKLFHSGKGDFASEVLDLNTTSKAIISVDMNGTNYMNNISVALDAVLGINLKSSTYTFKNNNAFINQLPVRFNGSIQLIENGQLFNLKFNTPTSSFKNMLALVPEQYSGNLSKVKTSGNFNLQGSINGILDEKKIPAFNLSIASKNAMFKYDDLPKSVKNINISTSVSNNTGYINDTKINIKNLSFTIDKDVFNTNGYIYNLTKNPKIELIANGTVDLANIAKVYPVDFKQNISGIINANVSTSFDMKSVETGKYQRIKNKGTIELNKFSYNGKELANPFIINKTSIKFSPNKISLTSFEAKTGKSDLKITGNLDNFYGFLFKNQELRGDFNLTSDFLNIADFMSPEVPSIKTEKTSNQTTSTTQNTSIKIPSFLNCSFNASAKHVNYDDLKLSDVSGVMFIKNESVALNNLKMSLFGGNIAMNGSVSTKQKVPVFKMNLGLKGLNISSSFKQMKILSSIAPIASTIEGKINSTIKLSGNLTNEMTPDINSISGELLGQLIDSKINANNSKLLNSLSSEMKFLDIKKLNLNDVKAILAFKNGKVNIKPFNLKYQDIKIQIKGFHGFDQQMKYDLKLDVPTKYLGSKINSFISKLSPKKAKKIKNVPVTASLSGSFSNPTVTTDLQKATSNLANQLIEQQKQDLIDQGKSKLEKLLNGKKDSSKVKQAANILKGLFGKKKKKKN